MFFKKFFTFHTLAPALLAAITLILVSSCGQSYEGTYRGTLTTYHEGQPYTTDVRLEVPEPNDDDKVNVTILGGVQGNITGKQDGSKIRGAEMNLQANSAVAVIGEPNEIHPDPAAHPEQRRSEENQEPTFSNDPNDEVRFDPNHATTDMAQANSCPFIFDGTLKFFEGDNDTMEAEGTFNDKSSIPYCSTGDTVYIKVTREAEDE